ncbi:MAG: helix-hairpin-helix domain-containing protein [Prevotella sp.]|nr:helix-hairpin-helix domain-containing protein [Prevotella sp.]
MKSFLLFILLITLSLPLHAQDIHPWEEDFNQWTTLDDSESGTWEELYETLCELEQQPININTATREQLEQLGFLSERQVEDICEYLYRYRQMQSLGELAMIPSIDFATRRLLTHFITIGPLPEQGWPSFNNIMKQGKHELFLDTRIPFYKRRGDDNGYLGGPVAHRFRYSFSHADNLRIGITGAQDAGEPFFGKHNPWGYDFYSFYVDVRHLGILEQLTVGRYRVTTGMGLVLNNQFGVGKLMSTNTAGTMGNILRPHASNYDGDYMQGAATTLRLAQRVELTAFASYRGIDATLAAHEDTITTIVTTGYHRTQTEMDKKNNTHETLVGTHLGIRTGGWRFGATFAYSHLDRTLQPDISQPYRRHYPSGDNFWNVSADYGYMAHHISITGETAMSKDGGIATVNSVNVQAAERLTLTLLHRYYAADYQALHAKAFSEGGRTQNEHGLYLGVRWNPSDHLLMQAYTDYAHFAEPRFIALHFSNTWDNMVQATVSHGVCSWTARYRLRYRQRDNTEKTALIGQWEQRGRLAFTIDGGWLKSTTQGDIAHSQFEKNSFGWMVSERLSAQVGRMVQLAASAGYFHTDDNDSRIYTMEPGLLYRYSFPSFEGEGLRMTFVARIDPTPRLTFIARVQSTNYFDRDHISSGLQQIDHSSMTDLQLQMRWKF